MGEHEKAIEVAAKKIDPLAFEDRSHPARGWEHATKEEWARVVTLRRRHAVKIARRMIAAFLRAVEPSEKMRKAGWVTNDRNYNPLAGDLPTDTFKAMSRALAEEIEER